MRGAPESTLARLPQPPLCTPPALRTPPFCAASIKVMVLQARALGLPPQGGSPETVILCQSQMFLTSLLARLPGARSRNTSGSPAPPSHSPLFTPAGSAQPVLKTQPPGQEVGVKVMRSRPSFCRPSLGFLLTSAYPSLLPIFKETRV